MSFNPHPTFTPLHSALHVYTLQLCINSGIELYVRLLSSVEIVPLHVERPSFSLFLTGLLASTRRATSAQCSTPCIDRIVGAMSEHPTSFFENKVVVVIGGASGIGAALCRSLAKERAKVIVADLNLPHAQELAKELGGPALALEVDVAIPASVQALIQNCATDYGAIHLLINSAGVMAQGDAQDFTDAEWSRVLSINLQGSVTATMAAYRVMLDQGFGHIVNIASLGGLNAPPFFLPYVTSKYAVVGLSIALRAEAEPHGVKVSVVCPGNVATPMISALPHMPSRLAPTVSPQRAAQEILRGIRLNRPVIVFPSYARLFWQLERNAPWLSSLLRRLIVRNANVEAGAEAALAILK